MNDNQRYVLIAVAAVMVVMLAFPPFVMDVQKGTFNAGYQFIFSSPEYETVNLGLLLMQWVAAAVAGAAAWFFFKDRE